MAWSLAIHHIDVVRSGDATLIIAEEDNLNIFRSCLIDGGRSGQSANLLNYLVRTLGRAPLNVMVCTHYDIDHVGGLIRLLTNIPNRAYFNNTRIYDQGWPQGTADVAYYAYARAVAGCNNFGPIFRPATNRIRVTNQVRSDNARILGGLYGLQVAYPPGGVAAINQPPDWLLGDEILWDGSGYTQRQLQGAPTVTCIAVNRYVQGGGANNPIGGIGVDPRNEKSLAFCVQFNNFKYYVGGDIETAQENYLQEYLNPTDDIAGRVLAFKPSHHGADTATSLAFVDRLKPDAAFVSCGTNNQYLHPAQPTVNILDGFPGVPPVNNNGEHTPTPPPPPYRPIWYYLTGYQVANANAAPPLQTFGGDSSYTAGNPLANPKIRGNIVLRVSEDQSENDVIGQVAVAVGAAAYEAAVALGTPENPNGEIAENFVHIAAVSSGAIVPAVAVAALLGVATAPENALQAALTAIGNTANVNRTDATYLGAIRNAVTNALNPIVNNLANAAGAAAYSAANGFSLNRTPQAVAAGVVND
ncbi:MAG TPA: MBL fold metallo-hydrolase, partial [Blastocatellia bacterium]|nr:MBL fold metallo-hydrolase [Blastocatellia bacterium]